MVSKRNFDHQGKEDEALKLLESQRLKQNREDLKDEFRQGGVSIIIEGFKKMDALVGR